MANDYCAGVASGAKQKAWIAIEETREVMAFPASADVINPTSDVTATQEIPITDSREKTDSLDTLNVFPGIAEPAQSNLSMYLRVAGMDAANAIQGQSLVRCLFGEIATKATAVVATALSDTVSSSDTLTVNSVASGIFPERGVIQVENADGDTELIHYLNITESTVTPGQFILSHLTRGYMNTTPIAVEVGDNVSVKSRWFKLAKCRPEFSLWLQTDTLLQCIEGASVTQCVVPFATTDAVEFQFTIQGRRLHNAGRSDLASDAAAGATTIIVDSHKNFFVGQRLQNITQKDDNATTGYLLTAINKQTNTLTISTGLSKGWSKDDVITWWMPRGAPSGIEVLNRETTILVGGERGMMRPGSFTISTPRSYTEEIGDTVPGQGIDTKRDINVEYSVYMRSDAAKRLQDAYEGIETRFDAELGQTQGRKVVLIGPRMKIATGSLSFEDPSVVIQSTGRFLGQGEGENSLQMILE